MNNLAMGYQAVGQMDQALPLYGRALEMMKAKLGPDHRETLNMMLNLAAAYRGTDRLDQALPLYEQILELRRKKLGPDHPDTLISVNDLAAVLWASRQLDRSVPLFEGLLQVQEKILGRNHPSTQLTVGNLGVNYKDINRIDEAIRLLEEAFESSRKFPKLAFVRNALLEAYWLGRRKESFFSLASEDLSIARGKLPAESLELAAQRYLELSLFAEAVGLLREGASIRQRLAPDAWTTFNAQAMLGAALLGLAKSSEGEQDRLQRLAEAEPLLISGYNGLKLREAKIPATPTNHHIPATLDRLIELYIALDKPAEVGKYRQLRQQYSEARGK
jgi:tetratricopeptide (TPR) repeat protein